MSEPHTWEARTLVRDLIPKFNFNVRLGSGVLARVYAYGGYWHVEREDGTSVDGLPIGRMCGWLNQEAAEPLGARDG